MSGLFEKYRSTLIGKTVGEVWRGHGSIFLECAEPGAVMRRDGLTDQWRGHYTVMIEGGWRIEDGASMMCDQSSDPVAWDAVSGRLAGSTIEDARLGANSELSVQLSGGLRLVSVAAPGEQPGWRIFDRRSVPGEEVWIKVKDGAIFEDR